MPTGVATSTSSLTQLMKVYYDKALLYYATPSMVIDQLADKSRDIPQREGKTVNFTRYIPLDIVETPTPEGENPDYVPLQAFNFEKTVSKYANSVRLTDLVKLTAYDDVANSAVMLQGENMGRSVNRLYRKAMATGFYPMRVDNSATEAKTGTVGNIKEVLKNLDGGQVEVRNQVGNRVVHLTIGKVDTEDKKLKQNFETIVAALNKNKPAKIKKQLIESVFLKPTMGPAVKVAV